MSWIATAIIGGSVVSGLIGAGASNSAANTQASAANNATATQLGMFNTIQGNLKPYMTAGNADLGTLQGYLNSSETGGPGGTPGLLHQFGAQDLNANLAPNYQFQLGQGQQSLANQNAATGGAGGGNAFSGEEALTQNMAGSAYQNAYNNYNNNQNNIYSRLGNLAQLGQASGTNSALGGSAFAGGMSNSIIGAGNASAAGQIGVANALSNGINGATSGYFLGNLSGNNGGNINTYSGGYSASNDPSSPAFVGPTQ